MRLKLSMDTIEQLTHPIKVWFNPIKIDNTPTLEFTTPPEILNSKVLKLQNVLNYFNETKQGVTQRAKQILYGINERELTLLDSIFNDEYFKRKPLPEQIIIKPEVALNQLTLQYNPIERAKFVYVYIDVFGNAWITDKQQRWYNFPHIKKDLAKLKLKDVYLTGWLQHPQNILNTTPVIYNTWLYSLDTKLYIEDIYDPSKTKTLKHRLFDFRSNFNIKNLDYIYLVDFEVAPYNPNRINKSLMTINYNCFVGKPELF